MIQKSSMEYKANAGLKMSDSNLSRNSASVDVDLGGFEQLNTAQLLLMLLLLLLLMVMLMLLLHVKLL